MGTTRDRASQIGYEGRLPLTIQEIEDAIIWDGVMETFVCKPAEDALANGVTFTNIKGAQLKKVTDWLEKTKFWEKADEALTSMRRTGFAAIWYKTDALDNSLPLDPAELKKITSSRQLVAFDGECMQADPYGYSQYDESPERWLVTSPGHPPVIHASRLIIFPGRSPSRRKRYENGGKGFPEVNIIWQAWLDWLTINHATPNIGIAFEEPVLGMEGLNRKMGSEQGAKEVRAKIADFAATRSAFRVSAIDSSEKYERIGPPVSGLADIYDRSAEFLAAKSGWPFSILFGKLQKSGLGGSGATDGEMQQWKGFLSKQWRKFLKPAAVQFLSDSQAVIGDLDTSFEPNPFQQHSKKENKEIEKIEAEIDAIYAKELIVDREEIRQELVKRGTWAIDPFKLPEADDMNVEEGEPEAPEESDDGEEDQGE
jgi:phage-related protein (TIGR01555 family)